MNLRVSPLGEFLGFLPVEVDFADLVRGSLKETLELVEVFELLSLDELVPCDEQL